MIGTSYEKFMKHIYNDKAIWFTDIRIKITISLLLLLALVDCFIILPIETDKEMNRKEILNQPMRVQIASLPCTVIISISE